MTVLLPAGIQHGTPEGFAAGCRREKDCPALAEHGMCCLFAHLRSTTDRRYHLAKQRDPSPAAIARRLGFSRADELAEAAAEIAAEEKFTQRSQLERAKKGKPLTAEELGFRRRWQRETSAPTTDPTPKETPMPTPADVAKTSKPLTVAPLPEISDVVVDEAPATPTAPKKKRTGHKPAPSASAALTKAERAECRAWAAANGEELGTAGRIPRAIVDAWLAARDETAVDEDATEWEMAAAQADDEEQLTDAEISDAAAEIVYEGMNEHGLYAESGAVDYADLTEKVAAGAIPISEARRRAGHPPIESAEFDEAMAAARQRAELEQLNRDADSEPDLDDWHTVPASFEAYANPSGPRPEWADVTIPEDIRRARSIAARLEEDNAQLQAALDTVIARWWAQVEENNRLQIALDAEKAANQVLRHTDWAIAQLRKGTQRIARRTIGRRR